MHLISSQILTFERITEIIAKKLKLQLSDDAKEKIMACRNYLDEKIKKNLISKINSYDEIEHSCRKNLLRKYFYFFSKKDQQDHWKGSP